jgi:hypothetical protein
MAKKVILDHRAYREPQDYKVQWAHEEKQVQQVLADCLEVKV